MGNGFHSGEIQHRVQQHGRMPVRQDEAVAIGPDWIGGIVTQELLPQTINHRGQSHGSAGMSGVGLLHRVNRQSADGVDAQGVELLARQYRLIAYGHEVLSLEYFVKTDSVKLARPAKHSSLSSSRYVRGAGTTSRLLMIH